jgi:predicted ATPase with chaperone activity
LSQQKSRSAILNIGFAAGANSRILMNEIATLSSPQTVEELGLPRVLLEDLALKVIYGDREVMLDELAAQLKVSFNVVHELFWSLRKAELCEAVGMTEGIHRVIATTQGRARALELLNQNQYTGPAPVSLKDYVDRVRAQSVKNYRVRPTSVEQAFQHLVLPSRMLKQLGIAAVSGTSIFLYGPTGTGKTSIAEAIPAIYYDRVWIPYAVEVDAQIITVFDPLVHRPDDRVEAAEGDGRWVLCQRPRVIVGGELTIEMLDLQFHPVSKFYAAPLQMKANNGALILDDFGRQRIRPEVLFNRWTVPLDRGIDFLTLVGGRKLEIPFDLFVVFATNLEPSHLADEAFLRRIHNKVKVDDMNREEFQQVFERLCGRLELKYDPGIAGFLANLLTTEWKQPLRPCYAVDVLNQIVWTAQYVGEPPCVDRESLSEACRNYFLGPAG